MATEMQNPRAHAGAGAPDRAPAGLLRRIPLVGWLVLGVLALDVIAFIVSGPFDPNPPAGQQGCPYPACFINGNLELPPPATILDFDSANPIVNGGLVITFHPSITNTLLTMWIVEALLLGLGLLAVRQMTAVPGRLQNFVEWGFESLESFARNTGGEAAVRHVPVFACFFLFILFSNWSGLVSPVGKIEQLRAPTSDVNVTIGLALVSFAYFEIQGFRASRLGYLGRFFPVGEFRNGIGAGLIAMFVGLIELMLEFVKPVTLSMRLFGNIYGGEVAIGVITALTVAVLPAVLLGLESMLNFVQALIFSTLTLMFAIIAMETHDEGEGAPEGAIHDSHREAAAA